MKKRLTGRENNHLGESGIDEELREGNVFFKVVGKPFLSMKSKVRTNFRIP
jgi:hypothetical protein